MRAARAQLKLALTSEVNALWGLKPACHCWRQDDRHEA